jgi:hypothetical protein
MKPWTIVACAGLAIAPSLDRAALAGDLQPPQGAIAPTMKPLDAIEPRVCLEDVPGDEGAVRLVTAPGIYVLTSDLVGEDGKDGIRINCDAFPQGEHHVVIALQGFSLRGSLASANAIIVQNSAPSARRVHVTITGSVRDAPGNPVPGSLITGWAVDGVHVEGATSVSLSGVRISSCLDDGFEATNAPALGTEVRCYTCVFERCGVDGVRVTLPAGGTSTLDFEEIECLHNSGHGARVHYSPGGQGSAGSTRLRMASMDASHNSLDGVRISVCADESISYDFEDIDMMRNGGHGGRISMDRSRSRSTSVSFQRCSSSSNDGDGFSCVVTNANPFAPSSILWDGCSSSGNGGDGVECVAFGTASWTRGACNDNAENGMLCGETDHFACGDSAFEGNGADGLRVSNGRRASIDNSRCVSNGTGPAGGSGLVCDNVIVCGCTHLIAFDNGGDGASFTSCSRIRAVSCDFMENDLDGLRCVGGSSLHASRCEASGNAGAGVSCADLAGDGRLDLVVCFENGGAGVLFDSPVGLGCGRVSLGSCVSSGNDGAGFELTCTLGGTIRRCESSGNGGAGFAVSGLGHVITENVAAANAGGGYVIPIPGNSVGPFIDEGKMPTNSNPGANYLR